MGSQFGVKIRQLREKKHLYLRQVAPFLDMDTAQLSKIEKGLRQIKREQIPIIANVLNTDSEHLLTLWLSDQIFSLIKGEKMANEALQLTKQKLKFQQNDL